jgi:hypothetical protein
VLSAGIVPFPILEARLKKRLRKQIA